MRLIDDLFGMGGGYVLDFSDRTFGAFFNDELNINIDDPRYSGHARGCSDVGRVAASACRVERSRCSAAMAWYSMVFTGTG